MAMILLATDRDDSRQGHSLKGNHSTRRGSMVQRFPVTPGYSTPTSLFAGLARLSTLPSLEL
ncbi:hypothetical protein RSAG8_09298, partial [Rhizoctonia solani AG-8 WAC10335]